MDAIQQCFRPIEPLPAACAALLINALCCSNALELLISSCTVCELPGPEQKPGAGDNPGMRAPTDSGMPLLGPSATGLGAAPGWNTQQMKDVCFQRHLARIS